MSSRTGWQARLPVTGTSRRWHQRTDQSPIYRRGRVRNAIASAMLIAAIGDHATVSVACIVVQDLLGGGSCSESRHTPIQQIAVEDRRRYRYRRISADLRRRARLPGHQKPRLLHRPAAEQACLCYRDFYPVTEVKSGLRNAKNVHPGRQSTCAPARMQPGEKARVFPEN